MIGPYVSLSAGMAPTQELLSDRIVEIGDRVLIGRNSSIVGHFHIVIEDDVFFGPNVYVTDQNHAFDDLTNANWKTEHARGASSHRCRFMDRY